MTDRSIEQINRKIDDGEANIYTAEEFKKLVKKGDAPGFDDVDVVTCGTCGVMSGTAAILNFIVYLFLRSALFILFFEFGVRSPDGPSGRYR